jgi:hypothetical protein
VIAGAVVVVVLAVAGPFIFFHFVEGNSPAPLSLKASAVSSTGGSATLAGSWQVGAGSRVGYRVQEILLGQRHTAVGRSTSVTGRMTVNGSTLRTASFTGFVTTQNHGIMEFLLDFRPA